MSLVRWKEEQDLMPFPSVIQGMQRNINRMFDNLFHGAGWDEEIQAAMWTPPVDVTEREQDYIVKVELPGVRKGDVHVTTRDNTLTIRGEKKQEKETKDTNLHRVERAYGSFQRSFTLPGMIRGDKIEASFRDGILEVLIPKAEEAKAKTIEVKVS